MALPIVAGAIAAAKSEALSGAVNAAREGVKGLFGDTETDKKREARADGLLAAALNGDGAAVTQLLFDAFEPRTGAVGDGRTPVDRKYSPDAVRDLARKALQSYYRTTGQLPPSQYAAKLSIPVPAKAPPLGVQVLRPIIDPVLREVGDAAVDSAVERSKEQASKIVPYAIGLVAIAFVVLIVVPKFLKSDNGRMA